MFLSGDRLHMIVFATSGSAGDAFITCVKLSALGDTPIRVFHYTKIVEFHPLIREIYSLLPNVDVYFVEERDMYNSRIHSHFADKDDEDIGYVAFPEFELEECEIPEDPYIAVCPQAGREYQDWRRMPTHIQQSLIYYSNCDTAITITPKNNTSIKQAFYQVANCDELFSMQGIMCFFALSQKVTTTIYYGAEHERQSIEARILPEWNDYLIDIIRI